MPGTVGTERTGSQTAKAATTTTPDLTRSTKWTTTTFRFRVKYPTSIELIRSATRY